MVNCYRDMWECRSEVLALLSELTSDKVPFKWTQNHKEAFDKIKKVVSQQTLLLYLDFSKPFEIHTDASDLQLDAVISQKNKPVSFYSKKLNPTQTRYTTTKNELLVIVEMVKEFKNILLGQQLKVYMEHKNITHKGHIFSRVMCWRLLIEEYGPELHYLPGQKIIADSLSRLEHDNNLGNHESFALENYEVMKYPLSYKLVMKYQQHDNQILNKLNMDKSYKLKEYKASRKVPSLITLHNKICIHGPLKCPMVSQSVMPSGNHTY